MPVCAQHLSHKHQKGEEWNSRPNEGPGSLGITSGKAGFTPCSHLTPILSELSWTSSSFSLTATWLGVKAGRRTDGRNSLCTWTDTWNRAFVQGWESFRLSHPSLCGRQAALFLRKHVWFCTEKSPCCHLIFSGRIWSKTNSLCKWVPGAVISVLPLLSEAEDAAAQF